MNDPTLPRPIDRKSIRSHSPYDDEPAVIMSQIAVGVAIQCRFCPGQSFRRSRLRVNDWKQIFLMRYPVRCLRCSQRQMVSFTLAGLAIPSHVKQQRARRESQQNHWSGPVKASLRPRPTNLVSSMETPASAATDTALSGENGD